MKTKTKRFFGWLLTALAAGGFIYMGIISVGFWPFILILISVAAALGLVVLIVWLLNSE